MARPLFIPVAKDDVSNLQSLSRGLGHFGLDNFLYSSTSIVLLAMFPESIFFFLVTTQGRICCFLSFSLSLCLNTAMLGNEEIGCRSVSIRLHLRCDEWEEGVFHSRVRKSKHWKKNECEVPFLCYTHLGKKLSRS